ncbi:hypothetical protein [Rhodococcus oxybenzonivorans]|nr:hypothetical protein [Rhodococcus oxybenzonivorans]
MACVATEALDAVLLRLGGVDRALDAADDAFQDALAYASRLKVND